MRFRRAGFTVAGAAGIAVLTATPALACHSGNIELTSNCGPTGVVWTVQTGNYGVSVEFAISLNGQSQGTVSVPSGGTATLPTTATEVWVWIAGQDHSRWGGPGDEGTALHGVDTNCQTPTPTPTTSMPASPTESAPAPSASPTASAPASSPSASPTKAPAAHAAKPVVETPTFTG
jgi:cell division septation protein DedD